VKELIATPRHDYIDRSSRFPTIEGMQEKGRAKGVLASGALIGGNGRHLWSAAA
jgi:hypothetical protein